MEHKVCNKCGIDKPLTDFCKADNNKMGHYSYCKECCRKRDSPEYVQKEERRKELFERGLKECTTCHEIKSLSEFHKRKTAKKDGLRNDCIVCQQNYARNFARTEEQRRKKKNRENNPAFLDKLKEYRKNSNKYKEYIKKYREGDKHREYIRNRIASGKAGKISKEWRRNNIERARKYFRDYYHEVAKKDPNYILSAHLRSRIRTALISQGLTKTEHVSDLIGCSIDFFRDYFQSLFKEDMNWDMFLDGDIHIDHIIPCAYFDLTNIDQQRQCFHWSNLQPLWGHDNLSKGSLYNGKRYRHSDIKK